MPSAETKVHLHHYPASPFSEKIRALLGYLGLAWHSVETSIIMPRPLLLPLSGGYRRVPVAQIGADVYCDTAIIARAIAEHAGDETLYAAGFTANRVAHAADTELFRVAVALTFRPEAMGGMSRGGDGVGGVSMEAPAQEARGSDDRPDRLTRRLGVRARPRTPRRRQAARVAAPHRP